MSWLIRSRKINLLIPNIPTKNWVLRVLTISALIFVIGWLFSLRFHIGYNPQTVGCISGTFFLIDHKNREPEVGKVFAYRANQAEPVYENGTLMAKFLAAGPGDTVEVTPDYRVLVNDKEFTRGLPHLKDADQATLKGFLGKRVLGADEFWMLGDRPMSFDSRYWGAISFSQLVGRAYVLF